MTALASPILRAMLIALALPAATVPLTAIAAETQPDELAAVNRAIRSITTLKATFQQTDANGGVQTGMLLLKRPGHVRFDYGKGDYLIVADGKMLYLIDYAVNQVQPYPIRNSPLGALLDPAGDLTRYGKLVPTGDPRTVSVEVHDSKHPEAGALTLVFARVASAPGGLELTGWLAKDAQGNRTVVRFSNSSYGIAIPDSAFAWRDPRPSQVGPRH